MEDSLETRSGRTGEVDVVLLDEDLHLRSGETGV